MGWKALFWYISHSYHNIEQLESIHSDMQYPNSTPDSINDIRWLILTIIYPLNISFLSGGKYII